MSRDTPNVQRGCKARYGACLRRARWMDRDTVEHGGRAPENIHGASLGDKRAFSVEVSLARPKIFAHTESRAFNDLAPENRTNNTTISPPPCMDCRSLGDA